MISLTVIHQTIQYEADFHLDLFYSLWSHKANPALYQNSEHISLKYKWTSLDHIGGIHWAAAIIANELGFFPALQLVIVQEIPPLRPKQDFWNIETCIFEWHQTNYAKRTGPIPVPVVSVLKLCTQSVCGLLVGGGVWFCFCFAYSPPEPRK